MGPAFVEVCSINIYERYVPPPLDVPAAAPPGGMAGALQPAAMQGSAYATAAPIAAAGGYPSTSASGYAPQGGSYGAQTGAAFAAAAYTGGPPGGVITQPGYGPPDAPGSWAAALPAAGAATGVTPGRNASGKSNPSWHSPPTAAAQLPAAQGHWAAPGAGPPLGGLSAAAASSGAPGQWGAVPQSATASLPGGDPAAVHGGPQHSAAAERTDLRAVLLKRKPSGGETLGAGGVQQPNGAGFGQTPQDAAGSLTTLQEAAAGAVKADGGAVPSGAVAGTPGGSGPRLPDGPRLADSDRMRKVRPVPALSASCPCLVASKCPCPSTPQRGERFGDDPPPPRDRDADRERERDHGHGGRDTDRGRDRERARDPPGVVSVVIDIGAEYVGAIIGRQGRTVAFITQESGAQAQVDRDAATVRLRGSAQQVAVAKEEVERIISSLAQRNAEAAGGGGERGGRGGRGSEPEGLPGTEPPAAAVATQPPAEVVKCGALA